MLKSEILSIPHAMFTPTFLYGSSRETVVDCVEKLMMVHQIFTLLQPDMRTNGLEVASVISPSTKKLDYPHLKKNLELNVNCI